MKPLKKSRCVSGECPNEITRRKPDPESFYGYGLAGTVARRCGRVFAEDSETHSERSVSREGQRAVIEGFVRHIKERIVMFVDGDVAPDDMKTWESRSASEHERGSHRVGGSPLTVIFDDGSAFIYGDSGYTAYPALSFRASSPKPVH